MENASQKLPQLVASGIMLMVYASLSSALLVLIILIDLRGIVSWTTIYYTLAASFSSFFLVVISYIQVHTLRSETETEKPSLTALSLTFLLDLFNLIGGWIASGLILTSHFWPTDMLTPYKIFFAWSQAYVWFSLVINIIREYNVIKEQKKKRKALREAEENALRKAEGEDPHEAKKEEPDEAEKKDPHEAEELGEKNSIAGPVSRF
ncbi:unnamed protein product, partial [Clonostachys solani]